MKIKELFPSKWIAPEDLQGKRHRLVMAGLTWQTVSGFRKPVLKFEQRTKGLLLNKTNANRIALMHGEETDDWPGRSVELHVIEIQVDGQTKASICVTPIASSKPTAEAGNG